MARGQSALEYLSDYGVGMLVVFIIGIALWQTNVFNPAAFFTAKYCGGFSQMHCTDFVLDSVGNLEFIFDNSGSSISDITLIDDQGRQIPSSTCENYVDLQNKATSDQRFHCTTPGSSLITGAVFGSVVSEQHVRVRYRLDSSGIYHVDSGNIKGPTG